MLPSLEEAAIACCVEAPHKLGMATMEDVAREARVSTATVSRVLRAPDKVSEDTRIRVRDAMSRLDYVPNLAGKSLRTSKTDRILVIVPDISNSFFGAVLRGIEEAAQEAGYAVILGDSRGDMDRERQYLDMYRRREADGVILLAHLSGETPLRSGNDDRSPAIVLACDYDTPEGVSAVRIDNRAAATEAMEHLLGLGHRRIGLITGPSQSRLTRDRLAGVRAAVGTVELKTETGDYSVAEGERLAQIMLTGVNRPTAIFAFNDEMALGVLAAARRLEIDCPADLSVVGFDDIRFARAAGPALTTVRQPTDALGRQAVALLLGVLEGAGEGVREIVLHHELVIRSSTSHPRFGG